MGVALNHPKGFTHSGMAENQDLLRSLWSSVNLEVNFFLKKFLLKYSALQ